VLKMVPERDLRKPGPHFDRAEILRDRSKGAFSLLLSLEQAKKVNISWSRRVSRVLSLIKSGNGHSAGTPVARRLLQPTREHKDGPPLEKTCVSSLFPYLVLHRVGFTKLFRSPGILVSSYLTFSPLPPDKPKAVCFLRHFP